MRASSLTTASTRYYGTSVDIRYECGSECSAGLKEGLKQAAEGLSSGLETAASALLYRPARSVKEGEGVGTAVLRAVRAAPGAIAAPVSAAAAATRVTLLGARNALDPARYEDRRR